MENNLEQLSAMLRIMADALDNINKDTQQEKERINAIEAENHMLKSKLHSIGQSLKEL